VMVILGAGGGGTFFSASLAAEFAYDSFWCRKRVLWYCQLMF